jgi:hypothetical protein
MNEETIYLVWTGLRGKPETIQLRAVDSSREVAERHIKMCETEAEMRDVPSRSWIEERDTNHLNCKGWEIQAYLRGDKTMFRQVLKVQPEQILVDRTKETGAMAIRMGSTAQDG